MRRRRGTARLVTGYQRPWRPSTDRDPTFGHAAGDYEEHLLRIESTVDPAPPGHVYVLRVGQFIKIGYTTNMQARLRNYRTHTAENVHLVVMFPGDRQFEKELHQRFDEHRVKREWFTLEVLPAIFDLAEEDAKNRAFGEGISYLAA